MIADTVITSDNWWVWKSWYKDILDGKAHSQAYDMIYATVPTEVWNQGPKAANTWIAERLAELDSAKAVPLSADPREAFENLSNVKSDQDSSAIDFFLSYSEKDKDFARFVDSVLIKAGFRVFVQFRDMPTGSDFIAEMNYGLSKASRFVAILSPRYNESLFCQAEWNAAYLSDPTGKERKIIPLLVEATDPQPLAGSRVYKSLVGLSKEEATAAILDAVGSKVSVEPDVSWPGAEALDNMSKATKAIFDVALNNNKQLAPVQNLSLQQSAARSYGYSAQELYADMRHAFHAYAEYIRETHRGNFFFSSQIQKTADEILNKTHQDWEESRPLEIERALRHALKAIENAEKNGDLPLGDITYHQSELRGMYRRLPSIYPELEQFREKSRFDRYVEPDEKAILGRTNILEKTADDRSVSSPELAKILKDSKSSIDELTELLMPEISEERRRKDLYEEDKSAAVHIVPVWSWIANPITKIGNAGSGMFKTIDRFERLEKSIDNAKDYFEWLSKWFY